MAEFFEAAWALRWVFVVGLGIWLAASAVVYREVWGMALGSIWAGLRALRVVLWR